jgi:hypothetical protein
MHRLPFRALVCSTVLLFASQATAAAGSAPPPAAPSAKKSDRCAKGKVPVKPRGRPLRCRPLPRRSPAANARVIGVALQRSPGDAGAIAGDWARGLGARSAAVTSFMEAELARLLARRRGARAAQDPAGFARTPIVGEVTWGESARDDAHRWRTGTDRREGTTLTGNTPETAGYGTSTEVYHKALVNRCPSEAGRVPGEYEYSIMQSRKTPAGEVSLQLRVTAELEGRVGDDARFISYDARVSVEAITSGFRIVDGRLRPLPTRVARGFFVRRGLGIRDLPTSSMELSRIDVRGPGGAPTPADIDLVTGAVAIAGDPGLPDAWQSAYDDWYRDEKCLKLEWDPQVTAVAPGDEEEGGVRIVRASDGKQTAVPIVLGSGNPLVTVSPAKAETRPKGVLRYTVAATRARRATTAGLTVGSLSRQGRLRDFGSIVVGVPRFRVTFTGSVNTVDSQTCVMDGNSLKIESTVNLSWTYTWEGVSLEAAGGRSGSIAYHARQGRYRGTSVQTINGEVTNDTSFDQPGDGQEMVVAGPAGALTAELRTHAVGTQGWQAGIGARVRLPAAPGETATVGVPPSRIGTPSPPPPGCSNDFSQQGGGRLTITRQ